MMEKSIFASKTFWGVMLAVLAPIAAKYGWTLDVEGWSNDFVTLSGVVLALWGRWTAEKPVRLL